MVHQYFFTTGVLLRRAEMIFPATQGGEHFNSISGCVAELVGGGAHYRSFTGPQERIDASLEREPARQARLAAIAQGADGVAMAPDLGIARLDRRGEREIRQCVLVRAVHL